MTHHARLNWIMLSAIIGVLIFLYFRPQSQDSHDYPIITNSVATATTLRIVSKHGEIVLEQRNDHWYITKPLRARPDAEKLEAIEKILTVKSQQRFPLVNLARYGLEPPYLELFVDSKRLAFGGFAPITNQQYVASGDAVYLIAPHFGLVLPQQVDGLIDRRLLATNEVPVGFEWENSTVKRLDDGWRQDVIDARPISNDAVLQQWVRIWQTVIASGLKINPQNLESSAMKVSLQGGQELIFRVSRTADAIVLQRQDEDIGYQFGVETGQLLLDPSMVRIN